MMTNNDFNNDDEFANYHDKSVLEGVARIDLDGSHAGVVTVEEAKYSRRRSQKNVRINPTMQGYPQDEMNLTGTKSKGRFIAPYGKKKVHEDMRGYGAAERGRKFYADDEDRDPVKTKG